nr:hypothetical protein CFP56_14351 [Quercus suber]
MTSFSEDLLGSRRFSLIPPRGFHAIIEWQKDEEGWFPYVSELPLGLEKKVKVVNLLPLMKKGSASRSAKSKSTKKVKGATTDASKACSEIDLFREDLPLIGNIVLKSTLPSSARTHSIRRFALAKSRPPLLRQPLDSPPSSRTHGNKRKTSPPISSTASERREVFVASDSSIKGFFDGADLIAEDMASATVATTREVYVKALVPQSEPIFPKEDVSVKEKVIKEFFLVCAKFSTSSKGGVSPMVAQTKGVPIATPPPVVSANDPFATFSQVDRGGSSLVVTPSSIPTSTTQMLDMELSLNKGFNETPKDSDDELAERAKCGRNAQF